MTVGIVGRPHGLDGTVAVNPDSDDPQRFRRGAQLWVGDERRTIVGVRATNGPFLIRFEGISDRTEAELLRGSIVSIEAAERRPLHADEYWPDQLVGLAVYDAAGQERGVVTGLIQADPQARLEIRTPAGIAEVPFVAALVLAVDLINNRVIVDDVEGLFTPR